MLDLQPRTTVRGLIAALGASVLVAACGPNATPTSSSTSAQTQAATSAPVPTAAVTQSVPPTAVARPTQPTSTADPQTTPSSAQAATNDAVKLTIDQSASQAKYHAREQLAGRNLPSEAVGTSSSVSGTLVLGADGSVLSDQSQIQVDLRQLKSDESRRDNFIQGNPLQTSRFPTATFVPTAVDGLPNPLPSSGQSTFQMSGNLTVHGVTKPVTWQVTAKFGDTQVSGNATTNVNISDFGMTPPKAGPVLSIDDALTLEMVFTANREA